MNKLIYITAFVSGFVLMGFEIFGTRVFQPYFGSGIHVWGALISVVMAGLSCGYAAGGIAADKKSPEKYLLKSLLAGGLLLLLFPLYSWIICRFIFSLDIGRKSSTLIAAVILFLFPAFFLGTITPLLVKLKVKDVDSVGKGAGTVYSIATAGSIAGTLITAYFLIGELPSSKAITLFGGLLMANAGIIAFRLYKKENSEP